MESTQSIQSNKSHNYNPNTQTNGQPIHQSHVQVALEGHLEFRCPHCQKLYMTDVGEIAEGPSYFECFDCQTLFGLEKIENVKGERIYSSFLIPTAQTSVLPGLEILEDEPAVMSEKMQSCPKCGSLAQLASKECYSCGVIFERYRLAHTEAGAVVHPSIARRWRDLVGDFANSQLHEEFLQLCQSLESLPYARRKYQDIKNLQGQDADCDKYLRKIDALLRPPVFKKEMHKLTKGEAKQPSVIKRAFLASPFVFSFILILVGSFGGASRNLVGVGISFAMMVFGMIYLIQKRFS